MAYAKNSNLSLLVLLALSHQKRVFIGFFFSTREEGKERKNTKQGSER